MELDGYRIETLLRNERRTICTDCDKPAMKGQFRCPECHQQRSRAVRLSAQNDSPAPDTPTRPHRNAG